MSLRYSQHARRSLVHARRLAQRYTHPEVDTDHLLLGIWRTEGSLGWQVLHELNIDQHKAETFLSRLHPAMPIPPETPVFSAGIQVALEFATDESRWLGHHYIGTEHILLGLMRAGMGKGTALLTELNISENQIRHRLRRLLNEGITEINLETAKRMARFSELSRRVLNAAGKAAEAYRHPAAGIEHLLLVLARERRSMASRILLESGLRQDWLMQDLEQMKVDAEPAAAAFDDVLDRAVDRAEALGTHYTGTDHILLAMSLDEKVQALLRAYNVDVERLQQKINDSLNK